MPGGVGLAGRVVEERCGWHTTWETGKAARRYSGRKRRRCLVGDTRKVFASSPDKGVALVRVADGGRLRAAEPALATGGKSIIMRGFPVCNEVPMSAKTAKTRVLLIEGYPLIRLAVEAALRHCPEFEICGFTGDAPSARERCAELHRTS